MPELLAIIGKALIIYFLVVSGLGLVLTCYDKAIAGNGKFSRVPEKTLMLIGALGGALVMYLTMRLIHHKTLHKKFMIGLPLLILLHVVIAFCYFYYLR